MLLRTWILFFNIAGLAYQYIDTYRYAQLYLRLIPIQDINISIRLTYDTIRTRISICYFISSLILSFGSSQLNNEKLGEIKVQFLPTYQEGPAKC